MPIITISRGTFAGGRAVAEGVAARLGYPCISREILDAVDEFGAPEEKLTASGQEPPRFWRDDPQRLMAHLNCRRASLIRLVRGWNLVYHGFAGHLLLPGVSHVLRVRIIADMEYRIKSAIGELGYSRGEAITMIKDLDDQSMKWALSLYGIQWNDPSLYDLVLNLDHVNLNSAVRIIVATAEMDEFQPTDESRRAFENLSLSSRVWAAIATDDRTRRADIRVSSEDGVVTITGNVGSEKVLAAIPLVARQVNGVKELRCEAGIGAHWMW